MIIKYLKNFLYLLILMPLNSCAMPFNYMSSPSIMFSNLTKSEVRNIRCKWTNLKQGVFEYKLVPGQTTSQSFSLSNIKDFYGSISLIWENETGQKFEKNFIFSEGDLPISEIEDARKRAKMKDYTNGDYITFEFTQDGVEFYTSHTPGALERAKKAGKIKNQIRQDLAKKK